MAETRKEKGQEGGVINIHTLAKERLESMMSRLEAVEQLSQGEGDLAQELKSRADAMLTKVVALTAQFEAIDVKAKLSGSGPNRVEVYTAVTALHEQIEGVLKAAQALATDEAEARKLLAEVEQNAGAAPFKTGREPRKGKAADKGTSKRAAKAARAAEPASSEPPVDEEEPAEEIPAEGAPLYLAPRSERERCVEAKFVRVDPTNPRKFVVVFSPGGEEKPLFRDQFLKEKPTGDIESSFPDSPDYKNPLEKLGLTEGQTIYVPFPRTRKLAEVRVEYAEGNKVYYWDGLTKEGNKHLDWVFVDKVTREKPDDKEIIEFQEVEIPPFDEGQTVYLPRQRGDKTLYEEVTFFYTLRNDATKAFVGFGEKGSGGKSWPVEWKILLKELPAGETPISQNPDSPYYEKKDKKELKPGDTVYHNVVKEGKATDIHREGRVESLEGSHAYVWFGKMEMKAGKLEKKLSKIPTKSLRTEKPAGIDIPPFIEERFVPDQRVYAQLDGETEYREFVYVGVNDDGSARLYIFDGKQKKVRSGFKVQADALLETPPAGVKVKTHDPDSPHYTKEDEITEDEITEDDLRTITRDDLEPGDVVVYKNEQRSIVDVTKGTDGKIVNISLRTISSNKILPSITKSETLALIEIPEETRRRIVERKRSGAPAAPDTSRKPDSGKVSFDQEPARGEMFYVTAPKLDAAGRPVDPPETDRILFQVSFVLPDKKQIRLMDANAKNRTFDLADWNAFPKERTTDKFSSGTRYETLIKEGVEFQIGDKPFKIGQRVKAHRIDGRIVEGKIVRWSTDPSDPLPLQILLDGDEILPVSRTGLNTVEAVSEPARHDVLDILGQEFQIGDKKFQIGQRVKAEGLTGDSIEGVIVRWSNDPADMQPLRLLQDGESDSLPILRDDLNSVEAVEAVIPPAAEKFEGEPLPGKCYVVGGRVLKVVEVDKSGDGKIKIKDLQFEQVFDRTRDEWKQIVDAGQPLREARDTDYLIQIVGDKFEFAGKELEIGKKYILTNRGNKIITVVAFIMGPEDSDKTVIIQQVSGALARISISENLVEAPTSSPDTDSDEEKFEGEPLPGKCYVLGTRVLKIEGVDLAGDGKITIRQLQYDAVNHRTRAQWKIMVDSQRPLREAVAADYLLNTPGDEFEIAGKEFEIGKKYIDGSDASEVGEAIAFVMGPEDSDRKITFKKASGEEHDFAHLVNLVEAPPDADPDAKKFEGEPQENTAYAISGAIINVLEVDPDGEGKVRVYNCRTEEEKEFIRATWADFVRAEGGIRVPNESDYSLETDGAEFVFNGETYTIGEQLVDTENEESEEVVTIQAFVMRPGDRSIKIVDENGNEEDITDPERLERLEPDNSTSPNPDVEARDTLADATGGADANPLDADTELRDTQSVDTNEIFDHDALGVLMAKFTQASLEEKDRNIDAVKENLQNIFDDVSLSAEKQAQLEEVVTQKGYGSLAEFINAWKNGGWKVVYNVMDTMVAHDLLGKINADPELQAIFRAEEEAEAEKNKKYKGIGGWLKRVVANSGLPLVAGLATAGLVAWLSGGIVPVAMAAAGAGTGTLTQRLLERAGFLSKEKKRKSAKEYVYARIKDEMVESQRTIGGKRFEAVLWETMNNNLEQGTEATVHMDSLDTLIDQLQNEIDVLESEMSALPATEKTQAEKEVLKLKQRRTMFMADRALLIHKENNPAISYNKKAQEATNKSAYFTEVWKKATQGVEDTILGGKKWNLYSHDQKKVWLGHLAASLLNAATAGTVAAALPGLGGWARAAVRGGVAFAVKGTEAAMQERSRFEGVQREQIRKAQTLLAKGDRASTYKAERILTDAYKTTKVADRLAAGAKKGALAGGVAAGLGAGVDAMRGVMTDWFDDTNDVFTTTDRNDLETLRPIPPKPGSSIHTESFPGDPPLRSEDLTLAEKPIYEKNVRDALGDSEIMRADSASEVAATYTAKQGDGFNNILNKWERDPELKEQIIDSLRETKKEWVNSALVKGRTMGLSGNRLEEYVDDRLIANWRVDFDKQQGVIMQGDGKDWLYTKTLYPNDVATLTFDPENGPLVEVTRADGSELPTQKSYALEDKTSFEPELLPEPPRSADIEGLGLKAYEPTADTEPVDLGPYEKVGDAPEARSADITGLGLKAYEPTVDTEPVDLGPYEKVGDAPAVSGSPELQASARDLERSISVFKQFNNTELSDSSRVNALRDYLGSTEGQKVNYNGVEYSIGTNNNVYFGLNGNRVLVTPENIDAISEFNKLTSNTSSILTREPEIRATLDEIYGREGAIPKSEWKVDWPKGLGQWMESVAQKENASLPDTYSEDQINRIVAEVQRLDKEIQAAHKSSNALAQAQVLEKLDSLKKLVQSGQFN